MAQAKLLKEEEKRYFQEEGAVNFSFLSSLEEELVARIFAGAERGPGFAARHFFASAITPTGMANHFETVFGAARCCFVLRGG